MAARRKRPSRTAAKPKRSKLTADLPTDLVAEVRAATVDLPPRAIGGSLSGLVEAALRRELEWLRDEFNEGQPFRSRGEVRKGRPPRL